MPEIDESAFALSLTPTLEGLQGEWTPVALVANGQPLADAMLAYGTRTMSGNETKVVFGGQTMVHAKIRLDESATRYGSAWRRQAHRDRRTSPATPAAGAR